MKITKEEQINQIKAVAKSIEKDGVRVTKSELGEMYVYHTTWLIKELSKAQKVNA